MNDFYRAYLDDGVCRVGTNCVKWDLMEKSFGRSDLIPCWVADMDFQTVPAVRDALVERAQHAIYGYTENPENEKQAEVGWQKRRHNFDCKPEWIMYSPGVIDSLHFAIGALTKPGDKILIQPPVYSPFKAAVELFERTLVKNCLKLTDAGWEMDFEDLESKLASGVKMMILCNPHNPVGRVWKQAELERVLELVNRYDVQLVVDEIHADFVFDNNRHIRILTLEGSDKCIMLTSATKSFNLAGLRQSSMIIKDEQLRQAVQTQIYKCHASTPNLFGGIAQMTAYKCGDEWMDAVVEYICENRNYVDKFLRENLPEIKCFPQQGSYLMWLDARGLNMSQEEAFDLFVNKAHVALNRGTDFGEEGEGFFRMNVATQHKNIVQAMDDIKKAIRGR